MIEVITTILIIHVFVGFILSLRWFWLGLFGATNRQDSYKGMAITALVFWPVGLLLELTNPTKKGEE